MPPPANTEGKVRAWNLATGNAPDHLGVTMTTRQVAAVMGISQPTAARWIREARDADAVIDLLERGEARLAQAARLDEYLRRLMTMMDDEQSPRDPLEVIPVAMKVEERWARLAGLDAPTRIQNETSNRAPEPDEELVRALSEARQTNAADRRAALGPRTATGEAVDQVNDEQNGDRDG